MKLLKAVGMMFLMLIMAALLLSTVNAQDKTTIVMYESIGGTADPPAGTTDLYGEVTLTATPSTGYVFSHWLYVGPELPHGPQGGQQAIWYNNPLNIGLDAAGYTVEWQAFFVPEGTASLQSSGMGVEQVVVFVAIAAVVVGVLAFVTGKRRR